MNHTNLTVNSDGFSFHTVELEYRFDSIYLYQKTLNELKHKFNDELIEKKNHQYLLTTFGKRGLKVSLYSYIQNNYETGYLKIVLNPRILIDPDAGYLGIMTKDSDSLKKLEKQFSKILKDTSLPQSINDYSVSRIDLCANIRCDEYGVTKEILRLMRKQLTPNKYERLPFVDSRATKNDGKKIDRHYFCIKCGSLEYVVYDKGFQVKNEGLKVGYMRLPKGLIRFEVHYKKGYTKDLQKDFKSKNSFQFIKAIAKQSRELMIKNTTKLFPVGDFIKHDEIITRIEMSKYSDETKKRMFWLISKINKGANMDKALKKLQEKYSMTDRQCKDLLNKFEELNINPVPLRSNFHYSSIPGIPELLERIGDNPEDGILLYAD